MNSVDEMIQGIIKENNLADWFIEYPWLKGYIGNPESEIWFVAENPSRKGLENIAVPKNDRTPNLQWNSHAGDLLLREAIAEAGLKLGDPRDADGWKCYITNAIKQPDYVSQRNKKKSSSFLHAESLRWMPVLQFQIDNGNAKVLVALGKEVERILKYMVKDGLKCPPLERIHHYSYIMFRPEARTKRGPGNKERIEEFKNSVITIANNYCS